MGQAGQAPGAVVSQGDPVAVGVLDVIELAVGPELPDRLVGLGQAIGPVAQDELAEVAG
jgi:hypothetical protein